MSKYAGKQARSRVTFVTALLAAALLVGCVMEDGSDADLAPEIWEVEEGSGESDWISGSDAAAIAAEATNAAPEADPVVPDGSPGAGPDLQNKNACTYIEWCNAPKSASASGFNWGTVCRVRSGCAIPNSGCTGDANYVCGGITYPALQIRVGLQIP